MTLSLPVRSRANNPAPSVAAPAALVLVVSRVVDADHVEPIRRRPVVASFDDARAIALRAFLDATREHGAATEVQLVDARSNAPVIIIGGAS